MISYQEEKTVDAAQLFELYQSMGWTEGIENREDHEALLQRVYENSDIVISAWQDEIMVGVVRALTDQLAHGHIYGLAINPKGNFEVAKELINRCIAKYPNIQWSAETEAWERPVFEELGFETSNNTFLFKGNCRV